MFITSDGSSRRQISVLFLCLCWFLSQQEDADLCSETALIGLQTGGPNIITLHFISKEQARSKEGAAIWLFRS